MIESLTANQALLKKLSEIVLSNLGNEHFGVRSLRLRDPLWRFYALVMKLENEALNLITKNCVIIKLICRN